MTKPHCVVIEQETSGRVTHGTRSDAKQKTRDRLRLFALFLLMCALCWHSDRAFSLSAGLEPANMARDGQHDFAFNIGVWHTHLRRVLDPLSGSPESIEINGTVTVRKVWDGRAQLEEIEADGPKGHCEALTLFLYSPKSHQWRQSFINSKIAMLTSPLVGAFKDRRGELFAQHTFNDRTILVRGVWSDIEPNSHRFEGSYSNDGGKEWAAAFIADLTRENHPVAPAIAAAAPGTNSQDADKDGQHDFDFDLGKWKTHSFRLLHPLSGSTTLVDMDGFTVVSKVRDGRANLAEYEVDGRAGHIPLLSLRWFNPAAHEWDIDFATPNVGSLGIPGIGEFKNGRGDFYDQEEINVKFVLVRFSIWRTGPDTAQSEQAFSDDGGKTWEVNWINNAGQLEKSLGENQLLRLPISTHELPRGLMPT